MQAKQSSARLTFRKFAQVGFFLIVAGVLGVSLAIIAGAFVLGDLSGAWQPGKVAAGKARPKGVVAVSYIAPLTRANQPPPASAAADTSKALIPAPLAPVPPDASTEPVRVARAIPVLPDVPVRRAQPVLLSAHATFNVRTEVADDQLVPRARPVSQAELTVQSQVQSYQPPVAGSVAQRDAVSLNW